MLFWAELRKGMLGNSVETLLFIFCLFLRRTGCETVILGFGLAVGGLAAEVLKELLVSLCDIGGIAHEKILGRTKGEQMIHEVITTGCVRSYSVVSTI